MRQFKRTVLLHFYFIHLQLHPRPVNKLICEDRTKKDFGKWSPKGLVRPCLECCEILTGKYGEAPRMGMGTQLTCAKVGLGWAAPKRGEVDIDARRIW